MSRQTRAADIILVATNAPTPTIVKADLENQGPKLIIDLSIPYNVETAAQQLNNVTLVNVDELSKLNGRIIQIKRQHPAQKKGGSSQGKRDHQNAYP